MLAKKRQNSSQPSPGKAAGAFVRRTITLSSAMDSKVEALAGQGKFSAFVQRAIHHELQRESIARWLGDREASRRGKPLNDDSVQFAERAWRRRR